MRRPTALHMAARSCGEHYVWPLCPGQRNGPTQRHRSTDDPEQVTCRRCLDLLTRP